MHSQQAFKNAFNSQTKRKVTVMKSYLVSFLVAFSVSASSSAITVRVASVTCPNVNNTASWDQYRDNSLFAIANNLSSFGGNPMFSPGAYLENGATVSPNALVASNTFHLWYGVANPSGGIANEGGNGFRFVTHITGDGQQFALDGLEVVVTGTGAGSNLGQTKNYAGLGYNSNAYGLDYGPDRIKDTPDDVIVDCNTPSSGSVLVDEIIMLGIGAAFDASCVPGATNQSKIDYVLNCLNAAAPFTVSATCTVRNSAGKVIGQGCSSFVVATSGLPFWSTAKCGSPKLPVMKWN